MVKRKQYISEQGGEMGGRERHTGRLVNAFATEQRERLWTGDLEEAREGLLASG